MQLQEPKYFYHPKVAELISKLNPSTISGAGAIYGHNKCEPLLVMIDSAIKWAESYYITYKVKIVSDNIQGEQLKNILKACKILSEFDSPLNADYDLTFDPKDDGTIYDLIVFAAALGGFELEDI